MNTIRSRVLSLSWECFSAIVFKDDVSTTQLALFLVIELTKGLVVLSQRMSP
jgi:hypothetical protein